MKTLFLESKYNGKIDFNNIEINKLPSRIGLITTVQFVDYLDSIKKYLNNKNKKIIIGKGKQKYKGQILGCDTSSAENIKNKVDAFLYIGTGHFHPLIVGVKTGKDVFMFNPLNNEFKKLENNEIEDYKKRKKGALLKFLNANNFGILVSTKPGQYYGIERLNHLIKNQLNKKYKDKKFYIFMAETVDYRQLENFPFIEAWVNTACPRIEEDIKIINIEEIK